MAAAGKAVQAGMEMEDGNEEYYDCGCGRTGNSACK